MTLSNKSILLGGLCDKLSSASTLINITHTCTHRDIAHIETDRPTHKYENTLTPVVLAVLSVLHHWINESLIKKIYLTQQGNNAFFFNSGIQLIRFSKIKFFLINKTNTGRNSANDQTTHTHNVHTVKTLKCLSNDEKSGVPNLTYFTNPYILMKKIWTHLFRESRKLKPSSPL